MPGCKEAKEGLMICPIVGIARAKKRIEIMVKR